MKSYNDETPEGFNEVPLPDLADLTPNVPDIEAIEAAQAAQMDAIDEWVYGTSGAAQSTAPTPDECIESITADLLARVPGQLPDEARALAAESIRRQLASGGIDPVFGFKSLQTVRSDARRIVRARLMAPQREVIERTYETVCADLEAAGVSFDLLIAWHHGER
jgi:hypothetical protein